MFGLLLGRSEVGEERMFSERLRLWSIFVGLSILQKIWLMCEVCCCVILAPRDGRRALAFWLHASESGSMTMSLAINSPHIRRTTPLQTLDSTLGYTSIYVTAPT